MSELVPIPLPLLLRRAFLEYPREGKIFDLPASKIFRGFPDLDLSVDFHGHRAATPLGPAAGPHGQLAQNIALSWLAGSRIIELKTVQTLDELKIPRPCIDAANVGYNVEWSQELKLEESLREYVKASMFLEILQASGMLGEGIPRDTVFDMSVGYNLEGIRSPRVRSWIAAMQNAAPIIEEFRAGLKDQFACCRHLEYRTCISDTIALSTFHGCPANEIEGIVTFLLAEMGCNVCIKLNPTLLGRERVQHLLHDVLGYREIQFHPPAFENDLQFDEALHLIPRLQTIARQHGRGLSLKFTNTLVVKNHKGVFADDLMYMSGAPLHVLAIDLVREFRSRFKEPIPISFSGGIDQHNMAAAVAMNFVPVTTCTDLLRPGGYARLSRYLGGLAEEMRRLNVTRIADFVLDFRGQRAAAAGDVHTAGLLNTSILAAEAAANPRYNWEHNRGTPRKIGTQLSVYDCLACDKCVPACPNDANFSYETQPVTIEYDNFVLLPKEIRRIPGGLLRVVKAEQYANYADACNECGNCDVFCPEDGGPFLAKPRFFGSLVSFQKATGPEAFYVDWSETPSIYGKLAGQEYALQLNHGRARFKQPGALIEIQLSDNRVLGWHVESETTFDMLPYLKLKLLAEAVSDPRHVNYVNAGAQPLPQENSQ
jgi:putative selenate reductase